LKRKSLPKHPFGPKEAYHAFVAWLFLPALAFVNGLFKDGVLEARWRGILPHQVSALILCALVFATAWFWLKWEGKNFRAPAMLLVGAAWLGLMLWFEFELGPRILRVPLDELKADYNILAGRFRLFVAATCFLAPFAANFAQNYRGESEINRWE